MAEFDTSDYEMKKFALAVSKIMVLAENVSALAEWQKLVEKTGIKIDEYPVLFQHFTGLMKAVSSKEQVERVFNNPMTDLALMYGIKDLENSPGEKSE